MNKLIYLILLVSFCAFLSAEKKHRDGGSTSPPKPIVGHWNLTSEDGKSPCIKMDAGIRLEIGYKIKNGTSRRTTIVSTGNETVSSERSACKNASRDLDEVLSLEFGPDRWLSFHFSRDNNITGDQAQEKWLMHKIQFDFTYDKADFPDAEKSGQRDQLSNHDSIKVVSGVRGHSYGCLQTDPLKLSEQFAVTLDNLRVQPFMATGEKYGPAEWCSKEQTSDLIPIIIGGLLAALVIIVLIAYLVGRARTRTTTYGNI